MTSAPTAKRGYIDSAALACACLGPVICLCPVMRKRRAPNPSSRLAHVGAASRNFAVLSTLTAAATCTRRFQER
eukprot:663754-Pleurochrysis_carterae.AAC.2